MIIRQRRHKLLESYGYYGPETSIIDGNYSQYRIGNDTFKVEEQCRKKYGKIFRVFMGDEPSLIITDLDLLRTIFYDYNSVFTERGSIFIDTPVCHGILFARFPRWKFMRKMLSTHFNTYKIRGEDSTQFIEKSIKLMLDYMDRKQAEAKAANKAADIDIHDLMKSTTLHLISDMAIQLPDVVVEEKNLYVANMDEYLASVDKGPIILAIKFPMFKAPLQFLATYYEHNSTIALVYKTITGIIEEHLKKLEKKEKVNESTKLIDQLIQLHYEGKLTYWEVLGNIEAILMAGFDTTSTSLAYIFWALAKHTDVQERLRKELLAYGADSRYLMQVINETMRLYPSVVTFTTRIANETVVINGRVIPKGTRVVYNNWLIHRDPDYWPNPLQFDPERFEESKSKTIHCCAFAPFGFAERKCLGYQLALIEIRSIVCDLLLRYRLKLKSPMDLQIKRYAEALTKPTEKIMIDFERL